jgi:amidase
VQHFRHDDLKFTYSPLHEPIGTVQPGERFRLDTEDCFSGRFRNPHDWSAENLRWVLENLDGVTGPIAVEGTSPGNVVEITLHEVIPTTPGSIATSPCDDPSPSDWWSQWNGCGSFPIVDGHVEFSDSIRIPIRPVVGCIATAPDRETVLSKMQGSYGGNMDCNEIRAESTVILPVYVPGAMLYFGDVKAVMGDGEIVQAPEIGTTITASVEVRARPPEMQWPRVTTPVELVTVVSAPTLDRAVGLAFAELLAWVVASTGMERQQAALLLAMVAHTGVCQIANSMHTSKCTVRRDKLPSLLRDNRPLD